MSTMDKHYKVEWSTTETFYYVAEVDAQTLASMIGVPVEDVVACGDDADAIRALYGKRGLENGLADIEDTDVEDPDRSASLEREVDSIEVEITPA